MVKMAISKFKILKEGLQIIKWLKNHLNELQNEMRNFRTACSKILKREIIMQEILFGKQHGTRSFA
jgi:hypothetical protein